MSSGSAAKQLPERAEPCVAGRYTIHQQIAAGGLGTVHLARLVGPSRFGRTVAVKRPHPHLARNPEFALMVIDEARLAARIRHPNVVATLDVIETPDDLVLVMDYVHGESLAKLAESAKAKEQRLPVSIAAAIMIDTLHGLHAAHEANDEQGQPLGLVHRDVSPQNILVGVDGISRLVDFGIAKATGRLQAATNVSSVKGKYAYMAPEQVRGEDVSRLTDTFAAAIVFWELLTGERLFLGRTDAETVHRCLVRRIRPPSKYASDLPPGLDEVLMKGLAREPQERYPTARAMALDIESRVPPIRLSEIGAWVEQMAGDSLAERAGVIAEIERSEAHENTPTPAIVRDRSQKIPTASIARTGSTPMPPAQGPESGSDALEVDDAAETSDRARISTPTVEQSGAHTVLAPLVSENHLVQATAKSRRRTVLRVGAVAALLVVAGGLMLSSREEPAGHAASSVPLQPAPSAPAIAAGTPAAPPPEPVAAGLASHRVPPSMQASPPTIPVASLPTANARPAWRSAPTTRSAPPKAPGGCNPPYSVDSLGRQIFQTGVLVRESTMKKAAPLVAFAVASAPLHLARAEDAKQVCIAASTEGQTLRKDEKLFDARERLTVCARDVCPEIVKSHCVRWLAELEAQIPTVVVRAQDSTGADLIDARLSIDGTPGKLDGRPVQLDPGPHTLLVETSKGVKKDAKVLLAAAEKSRVVVVQLPPPVAPPVPESPVTPSAAITAGAPPRREGQGPPAGAWILGGMGIAALGAAGFFAYEAQNELNHLSLPPPAGCAPRCTAEQTAPGRLDALLFEVSLGVGSAAVTSALLWAILAHGNGGDSGLAQRIDVRPVAGGGIVAFTRPFDIGFSSALRQIAVRDEP